MDRAIDIEIVDDVDPRDLTLLQADKRPRNRAIYADGTTDFAVDPHRLSRDAQGYVVAGNDRQGRDDP